VSSSGDVILVLLVCHVEGIWTSDLIETSRSFSWDFDSREREVCTVIVGCFRDRDRCKLELKLEITARETNCSRLTTTSSNFHQIPSHPNPLSPCYSVCFHSFFQNLTTCFDLCIGRCMLASPSDFSDLKTIIVIHSHSRSHYEMRRGSRRNLDLEKYSFSSEVHRRGENLIELNWSQKIECGSFR
jgi:hypothetical protein